MQRMFQRLHEAPTPIEEIAPDVPPKVVEICGRLMARQQRDRFQSAAELGDALGHWLTTASLGGFKRSEDSA